MTDGRCNTCRFWDNVENGRDYSQGICRRVFGDINPDPPRPTFILLFIRTPPTGQHAAELMTPYHFGCVLWEEKTSS